MANFNIQAFNNTPLAIILLIALLVAATRLLFIKRKLRTLKQSYQPLQQLANSIPYLMWIKDKQSRFLHVNKQFSSASGLSKKEIIGKTDLDICADPVQAQTYLADDLKTQELRKTFNIEEQRTSEDGSIAWAETIKVPVFDKHNQVVGTAGITRDISQRKQIEQKRTDQASVNDRLTNLPNRIAFKQHINALLSLNSGTVAVILLDLNNFKIINDSLDHTSGDQALVQIAKRLTLLVDEHTLVARLCGDQFVIAHHYQEQHSSLQQLQETLQQLFATPIRVKEIDFNINASFGVTLAPQDGNDYDTLLKNANLAMSQGRADNDKHCVRFIQKFADQLLYKMKLSNQLHSAIDKQEFSLVYQPKIDSSTGALVGCESLLRWKMDNEQWVPPTDFIPIAEKNGAIIELGQWVIKSVLQQIRHWLDNNMPVVPISVNVSAIQLRQADFAERLFQQLQHYRVPGHLLEIELTEGVLLENIDETIKLLNHIRQKGIVVSIDDFGTGYSSLSYLPLLPIDTLKIDRSFITDLHLNEDNQKIVQTIISLANNFNLAAIAEGVETEEELSATRSCDINNIQGYYYSRPLPIAELEELWLQKVAKTNRQPAFLF